MTRFNPPERYGIARRHPTRTRASSWWVSLIRDGKSVVGRSFSDSKYGGAESALKAAMRCRDEALARFPPTPRAVINQRLKANNTSGYPGVCIVHIRHRPYYCAQTQLPTVQCRPDSFRCLAMAKPARGNSRSLPVNAYRKAGEKLLRRFGWKPGAKPRPAALRHISRFRRQRNGACSWGWRVEISHKDYQSRPHIHGLGARRHRGVLREGTRLS